MLIQNFEIFQKIVTYLVKPKILGGHGPPPTRPLLISMNVLVAILTALFSKSTLFPNTTNGNLSGSLGEACMRNSSLQLSKDLKVVGAVTSYTNTQQSAPR